ncbi:DEAD/DEAH box helicase [Paenibacillus sp. LMG 31461]|uniref:DEAD/DEAH box helicase n=1 Tax=Paenibacillus plantarum TaxID=2654975 RepID=A0ABX1XBL9_9BACL|nr:helicase-related protein [Paenibacillus plantarum]NOU65777.1 DEAD/DEAH box helicase [Paenibacillus plantarum]
MERKLRLLEFINAYDGSDESFNNLKDIVCEISEQSSEKDEPLMKELLYIASQKMRTFGYNIMNDLHLEDLTSDDDFSFVFQNNLIDQYYTTTTGNRLDYNQMRVLREFQSLENKRLLVSAPTSFGKTFLLRELIYHNRDRYNNIALIFPTVSLLNENVFEFRRFIKEKQLKYKIINNTHIELEEHNLFILTPERMLHFINEYPTLKLDFFFMDEIYKIDNFFNTADNGENVVESERDGVFRITLYLLSKSTNDFYLAGPYINLDKIGDGFKRFIKKFSVIPINIKTELIKKEHIISWTSILRVNDEKIKYIDSSKLNKLKTIISYILNKNMGQTIVYAESKNKVTELARETRDLSPTGMNSKKLNDFIQHLERRYSFNHDGLQTSNSWSIVDALKKGFGVHHGSFPKYIQNEILERFNEGDIKFIFTTTSITEGVNTKAKNIIFYGKTKGHKELKSFDIRNINGRAGRYYHHFIGRIFYLESEIYKKLEQEDDKLDFVTFSDRSLGYIDLDNCHLDDLTISNAQAKALRDKIIFDEGIDPNILLKNRLVDSLKQLEIIKALKNLSKYELESLVAQCSSIRAFLSNNTIYRLLDYFHLVNILDEYEVRRYGIIATQYAMPNGFFLLLKHELDKTEQHSYETVDAAYMKVFYNIRNIVEYKVPKFVAIFGNLLEYVCQLSNVKSDTLAIDGIIRFYEVGVQTEIGSYLAEMGFPITAIKELESRMNDVMNFSREAIYNNFDYLEDQFKRILDTYELNLLRKLITT